MKMLFAVVILVVTLIIGVPVPFCFGAAIMLIVLTGGYQSSFLLPSGYSQISSVVLLAIPLFILAGGIMEKGKIGDALIGFVEKFVGTFRGGIGAVAVIASGVFGSISGSGFATLSCIGSIMFPKLKDNNYPRGIAAALVSNAAPVGGLLLPPSVAQILYAWSSQQSVLACFLAIVIPGIMLLTALCIVNYFMVRNLDLVIVKKEPPATWVRSTLKRAWIALPALFMPVIILGGIYGGIMTPTEAAAVSALYAIPVGFFIYRKMKLRDFKDAVLQSGTTTGVCMVMFFMVMILSKMFILENLPNKIADSILGISDNPMVVMLMINVFMILVGMLMDDVSSILLCTPMLLPLVMAIGVHPVHFAAILGVNLGMGNVTPPTAPIPFLGARLSNTPISEMIKPMFIFIIFAWLPVLAIVTLVPGLALAIPKMMLPAMFM